MSHWKALPNGLEPPARQFVTELRMLKDSGGLSLATLARRTSYSKSSWERYLNGKNLPPAEAVVEIARLGGADIDRLLALRSLAEECWQAGPGSAANGTEPTTATTGGDGREGDGGSGGDGVGSATGVDGSGAGVPDAEHPDAERPDATGPEAGGRANAPRRRRVLVMAAAGAAALTLMAVAAVLLLPSSEPTAAENRRVAPSPYVFTPGSTYSCDVHREGGLLYAGSSDTVEVLLQQISTSWHVVEVQCLLTYRGYPVGDIDGAYGAATERAVKRLQDDAGLPADGIVGPHTWEVLRR